MANLVRARGWGKVKPPPGSKIDWGHPLSQGLVFATVLDVGAPTDLVSGRMAVIGANGVTAYQRFANGATQLVKSPSQSLPFTGYTGPLTKASPANQISLFVIGSDAAPASAAADPWLVCTGANVGWKIFCNGNAGFSITDNVTAGNSVGSGPDLTANREYAVCATYDKTDGGRISLDGVLKGTSVGNATSVFAPGGSSVPTIGPIVGTLATGYVWLRRLTPDEVLWVSAEPYAFIAPPGPKIFYIGFNAPAVVALAGHGDNASAGRADIKITGSLAGHGDNSSAGRALLIETARLAGHGDASSAGTATLAGGQSVTLAGHGDAASAGNGAVQLTARLAGHGDAASAGNGAVQLTARLAGHGDAAAGSTAPLNRAVDLSGHGDAATGAAAPLTLVASLSGHGDAASGTSGAIKTILALAGHGDAAVGAPLALLALTLALVGRGANASAGIADITAGNITDPTPITWTIADLGHQATIWDRGHTATIVDTGHTETLSERI